MIWIFLPKCNFNCCLEVWNCNVKVVKLMVAWIWCTIYSDRSYCAVDTSVFCTIFICIKLYLNIVLYINMINWNIILHRYIFFHIVFLFLRKNSIWLYTYSACFHYFVRKPYTRFFSFIYHHVQHGFTLTYDICDFISITSAIHKEIPTPSKHPSFTRLLVVSVCLLFSSFLFDVFVLLFCTFYFWIVILCFVFLNSKLWPLFYHQLCFFVSFLFIYWINKVKTNHL